MIVKEEYKTRADGVKLFRTYSNEGKQIVQNETGIFYSEAIDVENAPYTYTESDLPVDGEELTEVEEKAQAYDVLMGVRE